MAKIEIVSIIYAPPKVLLGMKKVRFGKGKYNGFGGELKKGESLEECAIRETLEESQITMINPEKMGKILFQFESNEPDHLVHFFRAMNYTGKPVETEEMKPEWFNEKDIPYEKMWEDDKYWLPLLLRGQKFIGNFQFDLECKIKNHELKEVDSLD